MQIQNWDDLRYLLALKRGRSLSGAAKLLGINDTTVSRRISKLETNLGTTLIHRMPDGTIELTADGESITALTEHVEHHIGSIEETLGKDALQCRGVVRLTSVPMLINQLLTPNIVSLTGTHTELDIELIPDSRDLSLSRREADIAIRLARPTSGGTQVKTRKIGELPCSVFGLRKLTAKQFSKLPWIAYDESLAHIPPDRWIRNVAAKRSEAISNLKVHDAETALQAALTGVGKTVLPDFIAAHDKRLKRWSINSGSTPPAREVWLLHHANQSHLRRIRVVIEWIESVLNQQTL